MKYIVLLSLLVQSAIAGVTLTKLDFNKTDSQGKITVKFDGVMRGIPELKVMGEAVQVVIPDSKVKQNMEKSVSFSSGLKDTQIRAYQTTATQTKIKALLPFNIEKKSDLVTLKLENNHIELTFPRVKKAVKKVAQRGSILPKKKTKVKKEFLNKDYLDSLLDIEKKDEVAAQPKIIKPTVAKKDSEQKSEAKLSTTDAVQTTQAANQNIGSSNFSLVKYGGKFVAFLGLVLMLFYGVISLMKKGFIKKGKLGFLGSTDKIMVLNQHYLAPKRSLMMIKAHNQVFLVSNTEAGIHPISEIRDVAGLIKDEEKTLVGTNFDAKLDFAEADPINDAKIKIKEDISESNKESSLSSYNEIKEKIKFSDQIKEKVKGLKSLQ